MSKYSHPGGGVAIDAESLAGKRFPYQEDRSLVEDIDLLAATPGDDINWLEDIQLLVEDGVPAVFDRYTNAFIKIYFEIPAGPRGRAGAQGADQAPAVGQLLRHPAEARALQVPAAVPWLLGDGLRDGRHRLEAARCSRAGSRRSTDAHAYKGV